MPLSSVVVANRLPSISSVLAKNNGEVPCLEESGLAASRVFRLNVGLSHATAGSGNEAIGAGVLASDCGRGGRRRDSFMVRVIG